MASPRTDCEDREGSEHQGELGDVAERVLPGEAREDGHVSPTTALHEGLVEAPDAVPLHPVGALHPALVEAGHLQVDVQRPLPHVPDLDAGQLVRRAVQAARDVAAVTDTLAQLQTVSLERVTAGVHLGRDELQLLSLLHLGGGAALASLKFSTSLGDDWLTTAGAAAPNITASTRVSIAIGMRITEKRRFNTSITFQSLCPNRVLRHLSYITIKSVFVNNKLSQHYPGKIRSSINHDGSFFKIAIDDSQIDEILATISAPAAHHPITFP